MHDSRALTRASRRLFLLFVLPFLLPSGIDAATAPDALGFRGPASDGTFSGTVPARRPRIAWTLRTAGPINASPIWAEGLVIVGSGDGFLHAADGRTGAERWRFRTSGGIDGPAAYADGRLFFESRDGNLYAIGDAKG